MASLYSILITTYECHGEGPEMTRRNLNSIFKQTYRPIQVVVSDHSKDDKIEELVKSMNTNGVELIYSRYKEHYGNPVWNWGNALQYATGDLIRYFAMDDYFGDEDALETTVEYINTLTEKDWFVSAHRVAPGGGYFFPKWNNLILFMNTLSGPSAVTIRSSLKSIKMDPEFIMYLDTEWYYRLSIKVGLPAILPFPDWVNTIHQNQLSSSMCTTTSNKYELVNLFKKYGDIGYLNIMELVKEDNKRLRQYYTIPEIE